MAVVVENLPADADTRLRKQLRDLLSHGYRVSVITQAGAAQKVLPPPSWSDGNGSTLS